MSDDDQVALRLGQECKVGPLRTVGREVCVQGTARKLRESSRWPFS